MYTKEELRREGKAVLDVSAEELIEFRSAECVRYCHLKSRRSVIWQEELVSWLFQAQHSDKDQVFELLPGGTSVQFSWI